MTNTSSLLDLVSDFDEEDIEEYIVAAVTRGESVHQRNNLDYSLLMFAAMCTSSIPARIFLNAGANPNETRDETLCSMWEKGLTPFLYSILEDNIITAKLMLKHGANINTQNGTGLTALRIAASSGNVTMLKLLLDWSPNINRTDIDGKTAVMSAAESGNYECVETLISAGAKLDNITTRKKNIIDLAESDEIKTLLEKHCKGINFDTQEENNNKQDYSTEEVLEMLDVAKKIIRNPMWRIWYIFKRIITGKTY